MAPLDPAINAALEKALGHTPPFSSDECAAFSGHLTILHAQNLVGLEACTNLTGLDLFASNVENLSALSSMKKLARLRVACTRLRDISVLAQCKTLETVDLVFTLVENIEPLASLPKLRAAQIIANPLTQKSCETLMQFQESQKKRIGFSNKADWRITRELHDRSIPCCFGVFEGNSWFVRPGVPQIPNANCDFMLAPRELIQAVLPDPEFTINNLFSMMGLSDRSDQSPPHDFEFESHYSIGYEQDTSAWIADSKLDKSEKTALAQFVDHFSSLLFFKEDAAVLDAAEIKHRVKLPAWFRETRQTLAFVLPYDFVNVQLADIGTWSPPSENKSRLWYETGLRGVDNEEQRGIIDTNHLFPIGAWIPEGELVFAIKLDDESDHGVYSYRVHNITTNGNVPPDSILPVFPSYAEFLSHITTLRTDTGEVFHAHK